MKLLILTQKVDDDDPILGFFNTWIEEFSKKFEKVYIVCLQKGKINLPQNAEVFSLGKESGKSRFKYVFNLYKHLFNLNVQYQTVFVHMNPEYLVLAGWWWKLMGKKTALWYVHRQVNLKLRIAALFADKIFSVSQETFKLKSDKTRFIGHGVPLDQFKKPLNYKREDNEFKVVSVGRISPIKNLEVLIEAADILRKRITNLKVLIIGAPTKDGDDEYLKKLETIVSGKGLSEVVKFRNDISWHTINKQYWEADVSVNLSPTGGIDKAVLESMAAGTPAFVSNKAFEEYFGEYKKDLLFREQDAHDLAQKIIKFKDRGDKDGVINFITNTVKEKSSLQTLISNITKEIQ